MVRAALSAASTSFEMLSETLSYYVRRLRFRAWSRRLSSSQSLFTISAQLR